jgi:hypothetical protein
MLRKLIATLIRRQKPAFRDHVLEALALHRRGEARTDDPQLMDLTVRMELRWRAREIHPWDRDLPPVRAAQKLAQQTLKDTEAALERLFDACPAVDVIELSVVEPDRDGNHRIMFGTVRRDEFTQWHPLSTDMRLRLVGLHYRLVDEELQLLPADRLAEEKASISNSFQGDMSKHH